MNNILAPLSEAVNYGKYQDADKDTTKILMNTKYPDQDYLLAIQVKGDIKKIEDTNKDEITNDMIQKAQDDISKLSNKIEENIQNNSQKDNNAN